MGESTVSFLAGAPSISSIAKISQIAKKMNKKNVPETSAVKPNPSKSSFKKSVAKVQVLNNLMQVTPIKKVNILSGLSDAYGTDRSPLLSSHEKDFIVPPFISSVAA